MENKLNKIYMIGALVLLGLLIAYWGYALYSSISEKKHRRDEYNDLMSEIEELKDKVDFDQVNNRHIDLTPQPEQPAAEPKEPTKKVKKNEVEG